MRQLTDALLTRILSSSKISTQR